MEKNFASLDTSNPWFKVSVYVEDRAYEFYIGWNVQAPVINWVGVAWGTDHHKQLLAMEDEIKEKYKLQLNIVPEVSGLRVYQY